MNAIPGVCEHCGQVFLIRNPFAGSMTVTLTGTNTVGTCPCGGRIRIPNGVVQFVNDSIIQVTGSDLSADQLWKLAQALQNLDWEKATTEQVATIIEQQTPELSGLRSLLPKTRNELYAFIGILLLVINMVLGDSLVGKGDQLTPQQVERMVEQVIERSASTSTTPPQTPPPPTQTP